MIEPSNSKASKRWQKLLNKVQDEDEPTRAYRLHHKQDMPFIPLLYHPGYPNNQKMRPYYMPNVIYKGNKVLVHPEDLDFMRLFNYDTEDYPDLVSKLGDISSSYANFDVDNPTRPVFHGFIDDY
ncbi:hypothetical protein SNEBB_008196 [Seison nebaliae]|nr:hypothetical protein SNEBB_008196 [Seison nebaliae]